MNNDKQTIMIIDGYHLLHKSYYGSLKRKRIAVNRDGEKINAIFCFASKLNQLIDSGIYRTIIVAFDTNAPCWRYKDYPQYKQSRKETPEDLIPQMKIVRELCTAMNIPWYEKDGFEGDDVMGTISAIAEKIGYNVHIMTDDKDLYQLVDDNIKIVTKSSKRQKGQYVDRKVVEEKFGCEPEQVADMKALMGDSSDNIKGVKYLHYNQASKLLKQYGTVENIVDHINDLPGNLKKEFTQAKDQILMNKKITKIGKNIGLGRIDFRPMRINWWKYIRFLKKERMWAYVHYAEEKLEEAKKHQYKTDLKTNKKSEKISNKKMPKSVNCSADAQVFKNKQYIVGPQPKPAN